MLFIGAIKETCFQQNANKPNIPVVEMAMFSSTLPIYVANSEHAKKCSEQHSNTQQKTDQSIF